MIESAFSRSLKSLMKRLETATLLIEGLTRARCSMHKFLVVEAEAYIYNQCKLFEHDC